MFAAALSPSGAVGAGAGGLGAITEGERITTFPLSPNAQAAAAGKASSPLWRLPLFLMLQYFVLCVHDSESNSLCFVSSPSSSEEKMLTLRFLVLASIAATNGQLFLSFLNTFVILLHPIASSDCGD